MARRPILGMPKSAEFSDASIYQTWAYGATRWGERNLSHVVMRKGGRTLAVAQVRILRAPAVPLGVAYQRWGPLFQRNDLSPDPSVIQAMFESLSGGNIASAEVWPSKSYPTHTLDAALATTWRQLSPNAVSTRSPPFPATGHSMVDLAPDGKMIRKRLDQKWRNQLNGSEKNGLRLEVADDPRAYDEFTRLYEEMRRHKGFDSTVDVGEFERIQEALPSARRMKVFLASKDGHVVGALVCSLMGDTAVYLLGATNLRARELKASYFLHWQAMLWLKSQGARWYDLGGIDPVANAGGYHFKSGFGGRDMTQIAPVPMLPAF